MNKLIGTLTCPECGSKEKMKIPQNSCIPFYVCKNCRKTIHAKNSCCVFCDYGDRKCPVAHKG